MPQKSWAVGEEVLAADFNTYAQNQVVPQFTNTAQRDTQWASPPNGALCVTVDTNTIWQRIAGLWVGVGAGRGRLQFTETTVDQQLPTAMGNIANLVLSYTPPTATRRTRVKAMALCGTGAAIVAGAALLNLAVDGTDQAENMIQSYAAGPFNIQVSFERVFSNLTAAAHTFQVRMMATAAGCYMQYGWLELSDDGP